MKLIAEMFSKIKKCPYMYCYVVRPVALSCMDYQALRGFDFVNSINSSDLPSL